MFFQRALKHHSVKDFEADKDELSRACGHKHLCLRSLDGRRLLVDIHA